MKFNLDIRFYNTFNLAQPLLDYLLIELDNRGYKTKAYVSKWKYRNSNKGHDQIKHFEQAWLTQFSSFHKRFNQVGYCVAAFFKLLFTSPKLNVFFTQPPLFIIFGAWVSRIKGIQYGIHAMDLYPDLVGALGYLKEDGWLYKWMDKSMIKAMRRAEFVTVLGRCMEEYLLAKGIPQAKMNTVFNVPSISDSGKTSDFLAKEGLADKFTVLYAGNMGVAHEFDTLLKVISEFESSYPDIHFLIVGKGFRRKEVESYIEKEQPSNLKLFGYLENEEFEAILKDTDVHFISLRDDFNGLMVPSKLYSSLALSKPIIFEGSRKNEISLAMAEFGFGVHLPHNDFNGLKKTILGYKNDREALANASANAKVYFDTQCNVSEIINEYSQFLINQLS